MGGKRKQDSSEREWVSEAVATRVEDVAEL